MKWEPAAAMVLVVALGGWLVWGPPRLGNVQLRPNARLVEAQIGDVRGFLEIVGDNDKPEEQTFRFVSRDGEAGQVYGSALIEKLLGKDAFERIASRRVNPLFRLLKITSWRNVFWVMLGLGGQLLFSARMLLQWIASERSGKNIITVSFWWISLVAGLILFAYFAWRQDIVGVLGQSTGIVVYARNVKLHYKNARREKRAAAKAFFQANPADDPDPAAVPMVPPERDEP